ncbi:hypothetical protein ACLK1T_21775 [Escherichia coli]
MAARRRGEDTIDLRMGNPDGATPPHIVEKLCAVARAGHAWLLHFTGVPGYVAPFPVGIRIA